MKSINKINKILTNFKKRITPQMSKQNESILKNLLTSESMKR
jgi:hypothetical protein